MRPKSWGVWSILACMVFAVSLAASASAKDELFVVAANQDGDANFMLNNVDGTFSSQNIMQLTRSSGISLPFKISFGNGLGDFDNDGDLDYIMGMGYKSGYIFLSENLGLSADPAAPGYQFAGPLIIAAWGNGSFPMDMAVADFNEDGKTDFIVSVAGSTSTLLYLGDKCANDSKCFSFSPVILENSQPMFSAGADAADFNNDGHVDFVVAPADPKKLFSSGDPGQFYVVLGKGGRTLDDDPALFEDPISFDSYNKKPVWGVAAADFTGDGIADIAAVSDGYLLIYEGVGDGTFNDPDCDGDPKFPCYDEFKFAPFSPIDNFDFDGDGDQDLIAANLASEKTGVAVLLGNDDGTFTYEVNDYEEPVVYLGGTTGERVALTAAPYESNRNPVAVIEPAYLEVMAGKKVELDGSLSTDDDGKIASYWWDFGDATASGAKPDHIYYQAGIYKVALTVTDDKGAVDSVQVEVKVLPVPVTVKFSPYKLNLKSKDKWLLATIKMPDGYDVAQIDPDSITLATETSEPIRASLEYKHSFMAKIWRKIQRRMNVLAVKFNRQAVIEAIGGPNDNSVLKVEGRVFHNNGLADFAGSGTIKTYEKQKRWKWGFLKTRPKKSGHKSTENCAKRR